MYNNNKNNDDDMVLCNTRIIIIFVLSPTPHAPTRSAVRTGTDDIKSPCCVQIYGDRFNKKINKKITKTLVSFVGRLLCRRTPFSAAVYNYNNVVVDCRSYVAYICF